jgi:hypothetical protein
MIQVVSMEKRKYINRHKDFKVISPKQMKALLDYIVEELKDPSNSIVEISKWDDRTKERL